LVRGSSFLVLRFRSWFFVSAFQVPLSNFHFPPPTTDNRTKLDLHDGRRIRYSLSPEWLLTLDQTPAGAYIN